MPKTIGHPDNKLYSKSNPSSLKFHGADTYKPMPYTAPLHIPGEPYTLTLILNPKPETLHGAPPYPG